MVAGQPVPFALAPRDDAGNLTGRDLFSRRTKMVDLDKSVLKRNDLRCPGDRSALNQMLC